VHSSGGDDDDDDFEDENITDFYWFDKRRT